MERLRSQNSLFNSGESRGYREKEREREIIREIEITTLGKIREREDFRQVDQHIVVFPKREKIVIVTTKIIALAIIETEAQVERETSDN